MGGARRDCFVAGCVSGLVGLDKWLCGAGQVAELGYTYKLVEWLGGAG